MEGVSRRPRARLLLALVVLIAALSALALWLRAHDVPAAAPPVATGEPEATEDAVPVPQQTAAEEVATEPEETPADDDPYDDHPAVQRYAELSRYPANARRLNENSTDLLNPNMRHERRMRIGEPVAGDEPGWEVRYTADRYFVRGDEEIEVRLELWKQGEPVIPATLSMQAEKRSLATHKAERPLILRTTTRKFESSAEFTPNDHWPDHLGQVRVSATFSAPGLSEKTGSLSFFFTAESRIPGTFTGEFTDRLQNGNLIIGVGTEIKTAGTYRVAGNLYDGRGNPVAWTQFEGELQPGEHSVPLEFYGLIFHDAMARPPFVLNQIHGHRLRRGDSPDRENMPDAPGPYETQNSYALSDFRRDEHDSAKKQHMMELYKDALARGVKLTRPSEAVSN